MDSPSPLQSDAYNRDQRAYFESTIKKTMVPRDTPYLRRHVVEAMRFASLAPGDSVLEVGCGMGRYTLILAALGVSIAGLDLSPILLERLEAYNAGRFSIDLFRGDVDAPPHNLHGRYDVVMGFFVLHHVYDVGRAMHGVAQLLRPGGRAVFVEPNALNPLYYVQILTTPGMSWRAERGLLRMRPASMAGWLRDAGLSRFRTARFGFFPPFIANRPWARPIEGQLERISILRSFLPFQLFLGQQS